MFTKHLRSIFTIIIPIYLSLTTFLYAQSWTRITTSANAGASGWQTAVYDSTNNTMTLFAGSYSGGVSNNVWVLSDANGLGGTSEWTQLTWSSITPTARGSHTAVYDQTHNLMTIFGGFDYYANYMNDVWVLSHANGLGGTPSWTQLFPTQTTTNTPQTRWGHTAVYDTANNRMVIFGGREVYYPPQYANDVWVLNYANGQGGTPTWTRLTTTGTAPSARYGHTAVYDPTNNIMTIFGGYNGVYIGGNYLSDVWVLSHANGLGGTPAWTQLTWNGSAPSGRLHATAISDPTHNIMTIFGGEDKNGNYLNDVWVLSHANGQGGTPAWTQITFSDNTPVGRYGSSAVYDETHNLMTIFGGWESGAISGVGNDTWVLSDANNMPILLPTAKVYAAPTIGEGPLNVNFWDESLNNPTSWSWNFGDGSTSNLQNPTHVYGSVSYPTSYTVQLIAGNSYGASTATYVNYITVNPPAPPNYAKGVPSLKLFANQSFNNAFHLEDYNTGDLATSYSLYNNFAGLASLNGSTVSQGAYGSATVGTNTFIMGNSIGASTVNNEVKYSTYKIYKLPHVGLTVGSSWDVNVANYTYNSTGLALPPSFGMIDALTTDNPAIIANWSDSSTVHISSVSTFQGVANVFVTASLHATAPFGNNVDVERIQVYTNLLSHSTFSTANDTTIWSPMEIPPGRSTMATQQWITNHTDAAGTQATGVWKFTFADSNGGVKATPGVSNWINITNGQWYTFRIRLVADTPNNSHTALLFGYTNLPGAGTQTDIVGNVLFGVPTVWTWQEVPLLAHGSSTTGYPQFQFKAGGAGSVYVDEIQIINAAPTLLNARSNTKSHYLYGQFTTGNDTTGWGQQLYFGAGSAPNITVNNGLVLNFAGATSGSGQEGIKWTANNGVPGASHAYSFPVKQNYDMNVGLTLSIQSGNFNSLGIVLAAAYGVQTSGQQDIGTPPSNLIATAGVGVLNSGTYSAEGVAINPYYQGQFGIRSDKSGILVVSNVDVNVDNDDPNFGDATLFP